jgi:transmembrane sensor
VLVRGDAVPDTVQRLAAGQELVVRLSQPAPAPPPSSSSESTADHGVHAAPPSWFEQAQAGKFVAAYDALGPRGVEREAERTRSIDRLLSLSDVARKSGHPEAAVAPLERIVGEHPDRPEAGLSAVTLGRLLLDQLGQPRAAARAFERALAIAGSRGLRQDTYLRLVEAYERCGDQAAADGALQRYEREFRAERKGW